MAGEGSADITSFISMHPGRERIKDLVAAAVALTAGVAAAFIASLTLSTLGFAIFDLSLFLGVVAIVAIQVYALLIGGRLPYW